MTEPMKVFKRVAAFVNYKFAEVDGRARLRATYCLSKLWLAVEHKLENDVELDEGEDIDEDEE